MINIDLLPAIVVIVSIISFFCGITCEVSRRKQHDLLKERLAFQEECKEMLSDILYYAGNGANDIEDEERREEVCDYISELYNLLIEDKIKFDDNR